MWMYDIMNWLQKISQSLEPAPPDPPDPVDYPMAGGMVSGLRVIDDVENVSSIGASFMDYEILSGIREIPMSEFGSAAPHDNFYARNDIERCRSLAEEIRASGEIMPLIAVVDDKPGPYILEGGHRFVALHLLGVASIPALVVIDKDDDFS